LKVVPWLAVSAQELTRRLDVTSRRRPADLVLFGGTVLLPSGEFIESDIAIVGDRIADVAQDISGGTTRVDARGKTIVPGYLEPHAHIFGPMSINSYVSQSILHGSAFVLSDDSFTYTFLSDDQHATMYDTSGILPIELRWSSRIEPSPRTVSIGALKRQMYRSDVVQSGEVLVKNYLSTPNAKVISTLAANSRAGLRAEAHCPGASAATLNLASAAGITADHEARSADEVVRRLRAGLWAHLRYNGVLPDVDNIVPDLMETGLSLERVTLTTDWALPPWIATHGLIDAAIDAAMRGGMAPSDAFRCATSRPATYLGIDNLLGIIAPGRLASLNVLSEINAPLPEVVFSRGVEVARDGRLAIDVPDVPWAEIGPRRWSEHHAAPVLETFQCMVDDPPIQLVAASLVRPGVGEAEFGPLTCVAIDPANDTYSRARLFGMAPVRAMASTLSPSRFLVALGTDPDAIHLIVGLIIENGGGIAYVDAKGPHVLPLPIGGVITDAPFHVIRDFWDDIQLHLKGLGHPFDDPVATMLYMAADSLPGARFTSKGLIETRTNEVLFAARPLSW